MTALLLLWAAFCSNWQYCQLQVSHTFMSQQMRQYRYWTQDSHDSHQTSLNDVTTVPVPQWLQWQLQQWHVSPKQEMQQQKCHNFSSTNAKHLKLNKIQWFQAICILPKMTANNSTLKSLLLHVHIGSAIMTESNAQNLVLPLIRDIPAIMI